MVWVAGGKPVGRSVIEGFDPKTWRFTLKEARQTKTGESFEIFPPSGANWNLHDNTITGCLNPVVLDSHGSNTSLFKDNTVTRGDTSGVKQAVEVRGRFNLIGNHFSGFDEKDSSALSLYPDRLGQKPRNEYRDNVFERCASVLTESQKGLWETLSATVNSFTDCGTVPKAD